MAVFLVVASADAKIRPACRNGQAFTSTSYGPPWGGINGGGRTALGVGLGLRRDGTYPHIYGIAADPGVLRMGTWVRIWPNPFGYRGRFRVFDTGGAIRGLRIDIYQWKGRAAQLAWGVRQVRVCR